jgi:hypothetical protein
MLDGKRAFELFKTFPDSTKEPSPKCRRPPNLNNQVLGSGPLRTTNSINPKTITTAQYAC